MVRRPIIELEGILLARLVSQTVYREWEVTMGRSRVAEQRGDDDKAQRQLADARRLEGKMRDARRRHLDRIPAAVGMGNRIRRFGGVALDAEAHRTPRRNHLNVAIALEGLPYLSDAWYDVTGTIKGGALGGICASWFAGYEDPAVGWHSATASAYGPLGSLNPSEFHYRSTTDALRSPGVHHEQPYRRFARRQDRRAAPTRTSQGYHDQDGP